MFTLGSSPPFAARPASLAARDYALKHLTVPDSGAVIAISGGADSTALALAFADQLERRGVPYALALVDHQMREGSKQESQLVADRMRDLGVGDLHVLREEPAVPVELLEGAARELRHRLLEDFAYAWGRELGLAAVDILFGHTMDDQAETVLLRLGRGASARGLSAIRPRTEVVGGAEGGPQLHRGHPFLSLRRRQTEEFCAALGVLWVDDPTNSWEGSWVAADGRKLPRSAVRHRVLPELSEALGQDAVPALARLSDLLADDDAALRAQAEALYRQSTSAAGRVMLATDLLEGAAAAVRRRVYLIAWEACREGRGTLTASHLAATDRLITEAVDGPRSPVAKKVELPGGVVVVRGRREIAFGHHETGPQPSPGEGRRDGGWDCPTR